MALTVEQMNSELASYAFTQGIVAPTEVENFVKKMATACPDAVVKEKNLDSDVAKAYEAMMIEKGQNSPDIHQTSAVAASPAPAATAEETQAIRSRLANEHSSLLAVSQGTVIETIVLDKPEPKELIGAGTKGTINEKSWKTIMEKYDGKVLDDDPDDAPNPIKSRTNFNALKAAFESGQQVAVYIGKGSARPVALKVRKPASAGAGGAMQTMSMANFENFVVLETAGFVMATENTVGAKLRYIKAAPDKRNPGQIKQARAVLALSNKQKAIEAGNVDVSRTVTSEIKENASCKSELCFRVDTGKPKQNGSGNITRTVRVTVNAPVKCTVRKGEYVEELGTGDNKSGAGDLLTVPDKKAMEAINKAQVVKIADLRSRVASGDDFDLQVKYGDALSAFGTTAAPAASVTV